jgi:hypothetical protein
MEIQRKHKVIPPGEEDGSRSDAVAAVSPSPLAAASLSPRPLS